jgi:hypothetical protein
VRTGLIIALLLMTGCANMDPNTIYLLNKRVSDVESGRGSSAQAGSYQSRNQPADHMNYVMISVPLKNGGFYPVKIVQVSANVFKGPKGDTYYYRVPTSDQLKQLYP